MKNTGIRIEGYQGTWYIMSEEVYEDRTLYMLESEQYGEDAEALIVDKDLNVILNNVWNGWSDLDDHIEEGGIL